MKLSLPVYQLFYLLMLILSLSLPSAGNCQDITYIVNSTGDEHDLDYDPLFNEIGGNDDKKCDVGGGKCTLRAAIENHRVNSTNPGVNDPNDPNFYRQNKIEFNITLSAGTSAAKIMVTDRFRPILGKLHIDGTTQPGYDPAGNKIIELDGTNAGAAAFGFWLVGKACVIEGLAIHSFNGRGVLISATGGVTSNHIVRNNYIGVDPTGTIDKGNGAGGVLIQATFATDHNEISSNIIAGNGGPGVEIDGGGSSSTSATANTIHSNTIGVTFANDGEGVLIHRGATVNTVNNNKISANKKDGIRISGLSTDRNVVINNLIGTDPSGSSALPNLMNGVVIESGAKLNEIGGLTGDGNLISGNQLSGVLIDGTGTNNNNVRNNAIGVNKAENTALGNSNGVEIRGGAQLNHIGLQGIEGSQANLISGNRENGVLLSGAQTIGNNVRANLIGCNRAGTSPIANGTNGVAITLGANGNNVGGPFPEHGNLISGNGGNGVFITDNAFGIHVSANKIGTNLGATSALPNNGNGVHLTGGAKDNRIGGFMPDMGNIISGNGQNGVLITGESSNGNDVEYNKIGSGTDQQTPVPNSTNGVAIMEGAQANKIGAVSEDIEILANWIYANKANGVFISGDGTVGNFVQGNDILNNEANGVFITGGSKSNIIGEFFGLESEGNVIIRNKGNGILISGAGTDDNTVNANYIGTNDFGGGGSLSPNGENGVALTQGAKNNKIGRVASIPDDVPAPGNVIAGNTQNGVLISGAGTDNNIIQRNFIGTNQPTDMPVPNDGHGVLIAQGAQFNTIGFENVISGNKGNGVLITGGGTNGNFVIGNKIGTNATGSQALANNGTGVVITGGATANRIGGNDALFGNLISGNGQNNIEVSSPSTADNVIQNNNIGATLQQNNLVQKTTETTFAAAQGQEAISELISSGGTGILITDVRSSTITNNSVSAMGKGVVIRGLSTSIPISGNSIFNNSVMGIDLGDDGVTPNDAGDADTGPNNLQNFPLLTSVSSDGGNTTITGSLNSTANTMFRLEFFSNTVCNAGIGQGENFLGTHTVTTDATGNIAFTALLTGGSVANGSYITATATDPANNTSEFSACKLLGAASSADLAVVKTVDKTTLKVGEKLTYTISITNFGPDAATGITVKDVIPTGITPGQITPTQGSYNPSTGLWTVGTLSNTGNAVLTIVAAVVQTGTIVNTAELTQSDQPDPDSAPNNGIATEDDQSSVSVLVENTVASPAQQIEQLIADVNKLVTSGSLSSKDAKGLLADLDNALRQLNKGNTQGAINQMSSFIKDVEKLVNKGLLSSANGQQLIRAAQQIIVTLQKGLRTKPGINDTITKNPAALQSPTNVTLTAIAPNPFSTGTTIFFKLTKQSKVRLVVYDPNGKMVAVLIDQEMPSGLHRINWNPNNRSAGVYLLRINIGNTTTTHRMLYGK